MYRQLAPIYGENSAPKRWEETLFPWLVKPCEKGGCGLARGENEPCVLYSKERDLLITVYVDDILCDGKQEDIQWFFDKLAGRFECKEPEWLSKDNPLDFLGMDISMDDDNIYLSMETYVEKMLRNVGMTDVQEKDTPMTSEIEDLTPLSQHLRKAFMTSALIPISVSLKVSSEMRWLK